LLIAIARGLFVACLFSFSFFFFYALGCVAKRFRYGVGGPAVPPDTWSCPPGHLDPRTGCPPSGRIVSPAQSCNGVSKWKCVTVSGSWRDGARIRLPLRLRTNAAFFDASASITVARRMECSTTLHAEWSASETKCLYT